MPAMRNKYKSAYSWSDRPLELDALSDAMMEHIDATVNKKMSHRERGEDMKVRYKVQKVQDDYVERLEEENLTLVQQVETIRTDMEMQIDDIRSNMVVESNKVRTALELKVYDLKEHIKANRDIHNRAIEEAVDVLDMVVMPLVIQDEQLHGKLNETLNQLRQTVDYSTM